jgi:phage repressor protein C with HTH and peptisase S24 domain
MITNNRYMENTTKERLMTFLKSENIGQNTFEKKVGWSTGYINNIKSSIGSDKISSIIKEYPLLNLSWLLTGEGEMLRTATDDSAADKQKALPLIPFEALAGYLSTDNEGVMVEDCERYVIPEFDRRGAEFIIRVSGSSMYPKYSNGDLLGCKKIEDILFFQWGKIYVLDTSQGALVKRVYEHENKDFVMLVSDNKDVYPPFPIPKSDIRSLSIVVGVIRLE